MTDYVPALTALSLVISAMTPVLLAIIVRRQTAAAVKVDAAAEKVESVRTDLQAQTQGITTEVKAIHTAVNSERTALMNEIRDMHATIRQLTADKAALEQAQEGKTPPGTTRTPSGGHGQA